MKIGLTLNWKAKWHKPLLSPESWQVLPQGEAYCNVLTHYFAQWTPKILCYQMPLLPLLACITSYLRT